MLAAACRVGRAAAQLALARRGGRGTRVALRAPAVAWLPRRLFTGSCGFMPYDGCALLVLHGRLRALDVARGAPTELGPALGASASGRGFHSVRRGPLGAGLQLVGGQRLSAGGCQTPVAAWHLWRLFAGGRGFMLLRSGRVAAACAWCRTAGRARLALR
eukprot:10794390-Alexandrium_andersonii.AAC.1